MPRLHPNLARPPPPTCCCCCRCCCCRAVVQQRRAAAAAAGPAEQDVGRLDVPVRVAPAVHVLHALAHLRRQPAEVQQQVGPPAHQGPALPPGQPRWQPCWQPTCMNMSSTSLVPSFWPAAASRSTSSASEPSCGPPGMGKVCGRAAGVAQAAAAPGAIGHRTSRRAQPALCPSRAGCSALFGSACQGPSARPPPSASAPHEQGGSARQPGQLVRWAAACAAGEARARGGAAGRQPTWYAGKSRYTKRSEASWSGPSCAEASPATQLSMRCSTQGWLSCCSVRTSRCASARRSLVQAFTCGGAGRRGGLAAAAARGCGAVLLLLPCGACARRQGAAAGPWCSRALGIALPPHCGQGWQGRRRARARAQPGGRAAVGGQPGCWLLAGGAPAHPLERVQRVLHQRLLRRRHLPHQEYVRVAALAELRRGGAGGGCVEQNLLCKHMEVAAVALADNAPGGANHLADRSEAPVVELELLS
jgi:hypothetical protein